ncbi:MAG: PEP-CTERM sorting domain-containing protein [Halioglobus sp.]|nr:PEP-CTERM sorting domain-containing protein [Halioglobus sp.]
MKLLKSTISILAASLGTAMLAGPAAAVPMPTAALDYDGTINFSLSNGLSVIGSMDAQYRTPPGAPQPYEFNTSLSFGSVTITPVLTVTTPEFVLIPGGETCLPFIGCFTTPDVTLPSQIIPLTPSISLTEPVNVYTYSYTSGELPVGTVFNTDFGTPLLGEALTIDDLVREQFETGATSVNESGSVVGSLMGSYEYEGELQPDGNTILADYMLNLSSPELLAELEASLLELINDNTAMLSEAALQALIASNPCSGLGVGEGICNDLINGLDSSQLQVVVNSIGTFSSTYSLQKSIIPVPAPATLPLLALGVALMGLASARRRKTGTA